MNTYLISIDPVRYAKILNGDITALVEIKARISEK